MLATFKHAAAVTVTMSHMLLPSAASTCKLWETQHSQQLTSQWVKVWPEALSMPVL